MRKYMLSAIVALVAIFALGVNTYAGPFAPAKPPLGGEPTSLTQSTAEIIHPEKESPSQN